jgi:hypothetical protein
MKTIFGIFGILLLTMSCESNKMANDDSAKKGSIIQGTWINEVRTYDTLVFVNDSILTKTYLSGDKEFFKYSISADSITFNHKGPLKILIPPYTNYFTIDNKILTLYPYGINNEKLIYIKQ